MVREGGAAGRPVSPSSPYCWQCWDRITAIRAALALRELDGPALNVCATLADYNEALAGVRKIRAVQTRRRIIRAVHARLPQGSIQEVALMLDLDRSTVDAALAEGV